MNETAIPKVFKHNTSTSFKQDIHNNWYFIYEGVFYGKNDGLNGYKSFAVMSNESRSFRRNDIKTITYEQKRLFLLYAIDNYTLNKGYHLGLCSLFMKYINTVYPDCTRNSFHDLFPEMLENRPYNYNYYIPYWFDEGDRHARIAYCIKVLNIIEKKQVAKIT